MTSSTTNPMALKPELDSSDDEELETVKQEIMKSATDESNSEEGEIRDPFLDLVVNLRIAAA